MSSPSEASVFELLSNLTSSLESAIEASPDSSTLHPPLEDLSLLTTKNELFLSYVQNLVFLILLKLRHSSLKWNGDDEDPAAAAIHIKIVEKLAELRLYLEKGVKPLESRLKYQVDKVLRAADDASRPRAAHRPPKKSKEQIILRTLGDTSGSDQSHQPSHDESDDSELEELAAQPNQAALLRPANAMKKDVAQRKDGIYKPPKITPTALPMTMSKEEKTERRPTKSAAVDEFIAAELSSAPVAEPSIGSTIRSGGRHVLSQREREVAAERRRYEEENFIRLPSNKKDRPKNKKSQNSFGGEEWRNLGAGLDKIQNLSKRGSSSAAVLARSRKRAVQDGPRGSGFGAESFSAKRLRK